MAVPTIVPTEFTGTSQDFNIAKIDRTGAARPQFVTVSVPSGTASGTVVGLVPFRRGATLVRGATSVHIANIGDGSFTADVGFVYQSASFTDDPDAFAAADIAGRTGGFVTLGATAGLSWVAEADGWIAVTTGGSSTDNTGSIQGQITLAYDN